MFKTIDLVHKYGYKHKFNQKMIDSFFVSQHSQHFYW